MYSEIPILKDSDKSRFWSKVDKKTNNSCWNWTASTRRGYGRLCITTDKSEKTFASHRLSFFMHNNIDPKDSVIMHSCDNKRCVNPNHLSMGSSKDNTDDMMRKNRGKNQFESGEDHSRTKLTKAQVLEIRLNSGKFTQSDLGRKYGVDASMISRIVNKKLWKTV